MNKPKFYLTTPIYYVNARPHLGHTYTTVVADTIARYKRMRGYDVVLLTGTDEHGQKVERSAKAAGIPPQEFVDLISAEYRRLWEELGLSIDRFVRTTELRHARAVQRLFRKAVDAGYVYKGHYEGQYCVFDELYVDDPTPQAPCPECGRPTERIREENYFFKLSAFQDRLLEHYEKHREFVQPETRRNEVMAFVRGGLRDLSISRTTLKWGIPWPGDEQHVFYVWSDALTTYMTGVGYGDNQAEFERLWPADLHLIGKEILRFHAVYWPAFLMAAGEPVPGQVFAHGWWLFEEEKMSKSRGNIQLPQPIVRVLGSDALRYFLLREMVFGQDGNFSRDALITRYNADLANGLGNLASRTLTMIDRYFNGKIPDSPRGATVSEDEENPDRGVKQHAELIAKQDPNVPGVPWSFDNFQFSTALETLWTLVSAVDGYLTSTRPWELAEEATKRQRLADVLYTAAEALRFIAVLAHPVLPQATRKIWEQLGQPGRLEDQPIDKLVWGQLKPSTRIGKPEAIFPRVDKEEAIERIEAMEQDMRKPAAAPAAPAAAAAPQAPARIGIEDFAKVEMRVGQIKSAERVAGADKLLKVLVDIGDEVRQLVAGIAEVYKPEDLLGRKVVVVTNLQPRKLRGVESNGMIVAASAPPDGKPVLVSFLEDVPIGARLK
ncbi:MAG TPA: methionine--tRNA ligase [Candidatus Acidoferrales bacterium]|nr:methionine--tRNA ligase [Candidatus Acidoferrales bacterium]